MLNTGLHYSSTAQVSQGVVPGIPVTHVAQASDVRYGAQVSDSCKTQVQAPEVQQITRTLGYVGKGKPSTYFYAHGALSGSKPPEKVIDPDTSEVVRLTIPYTIKACCDQAPSLAPALVPDALRVLGISQDVWQRWMFDELESRVQSLTQSATSDVLGCAVLMMLPFLWCFVCHGWYTEVDKWNTALNNWTIDFNEVELKKRGLLLKPQSHCDKSGNVERWFTISLNEQETQRLLQEGTRFGGYSSDGAFKSCGGPDQDKLTIHN